MAPLELNPPLVAGTLRLEPLVAAHAAELYDTLADPALYRYLDDTPPESVDAVRWTCERREPRRSPDGLQIWLNWLVRGGDGRALGYVQATLTSPGEAWIGYVFARSAQGRGDATRSVAALLGHLERDLGVERALASADVDNLRSIALLGRLGFTAMDDAARLAAGLEAHERLFVRFGSAA